MNAGPLVRVTVASAVIAVSLLASISCSRHTIIVEYERTTAYRFSGSDRRVIESIAEGAAADVRRLLPALPEHLRIRVRVGTDVLPETGAMGSAFSPDYVSWTVDPSWAGGVEAIARRWLRATLFHEFHHLVRGMTIPTESVLDRAITEGMATAFERADGGKTGPWGNYPDNVADWAKEFMALPHDAKFDASVGYKVGTYLVDRACAASGRTPANLVSVPTVDVVAMALGRDNPR